MSLPVTNIDFNEIKSQLKDFLRNQTEFVDFDFDGSAMSVLLDVMAYTVHYMAIHANLSISEIFLDSAVLRNSVVSKAKELGYFPRQIFGATATVKLSITPAINPNAPIIIPKNTKFSTVIDNVNYEFVTTDSGLLLEETLNPGTYSGDINITEGVFDTQTWVYDALDTDQRFIILQKNIDVRFLSVDVADSVGSPTIVAWSPVGSFVNITPLDKVFFMQEVNDERVEIYFGDDVLGAALIDGNEITAEYLTTKGVDANGAGVFELINDIGIYLKGEFTVTTVYKAGGGADAESIASIKHIAPKFYQMQNRAVSADDYRTLLLANYGDIETVSVWGGENAVPPQYGRVFVSIKPLSGDTLSPGAKEYIQTEILEKYNVVGIIPELIDPEYTYLDIVSEVIYDREKTSLGQGDIVNKVQTAIETYFSDKLSQFDTTFRFSRFVAAIDAADVSILNNRTDVFMTKKFDTISGSRTYVISFNNAIKKGTVVSEEYDRGGADTYQLVENTLTEKLDEYKNGSLLNSGIGIIDYENGQITLQGYNFQVALSGYSLTVVPELEDIETLRNNLLLLGVTTITATYEI